MTATITHLLLDFFGTIVDYSPSRTEQDYSPSYGLLQRLGASLAYGDFLALGDEIFSAYEERSAGDLSEFAMQEPSTVILESALGRPATSGETDAFVASYLQDWNSAVSYPGGMADLLRDLAGRYRLAVVSNTHSRTLVPDHLRALGVAELFDAVVLSIDLGVRKPHPEIYRAALDQLGIDATAALFVGDTYAADYDGPRRLGIRALLIDPGRSAPVPEQDRLAGLVDLGDRLPRSEHVAEQPPRGVQAAHAVHTRPGRGG
ncbi:MAG: HAD family hydrolase [Microlunatus sp.]|nr:HAD family hydrolase [Microlunatus sp.]